MVKGLFLMDKCEGIKIGVNLLQGTSGLTKSANVNIPAVNNFKNDLFVKSPKKYSATGVTTYPSKPEYTSKQKLNSFLNADYTRFLISTNTELKTKLETYALKDININNLTSIKNKHLMTTSLYARQIANQLKLNDADKKTLEDACMLHDIGKIFIPEEILNKPTLLTKEEKEIMDLHSELGYELLKGTGVNKRTCEIVRNHHKPCAASTDKLSQILSVADIYSALREKRPYKDSLSSKEAFEILDQKANAGEVSTEVVNALKKASISVR